MRKGRRIWLWALIFAMVAVGSFVIVAKALTPPEPVYDGKPVSYWINRPKVNMLVLSIVIPDAVFPKSIDARALPYLTNALHRSDRGFYGMSRYVWEKSPEIVKRHWAPPARPADVRAAAAVAIGYLRESAWPAMPALIRAVKEDKDPQVRECAMFSLILIGLGDPAVTECLTVASRDTNPEVSAMARSGLLAITQRAEVIGTSNRVNRRAP